MTLLQTLFRSAAIRLTGKAAIALAATSLAADANFEVKSQDDRIMCRAVGGYVSTRIATPWCFQTDFDRMCAKLFKSGGYYKGTVADHATHFDRRKCFETKGDGGIL